MTPTAIDMKRLPLCLEYQQQIAFRRYNCPTCDAMYAALEALCKFAGGRR